MTSIEGPLYNNKQNKLNLSVITEEQLIDKTNFMFLDIVNVDDGFYYFNDNWSYIQIENNRIIRQVYFGDTNSLCASMIKLYKYEENVIKSYIMYPQKENEFKLYSVIPDTEYSRNEIRSFVNVLGSSNYSITTPYMFDEIVGNSGEKIVRLVKGKIVYG